MALVNKSIGRAGTTLVSCNVSELNHLVKRSKVFTHLSKLKAGIVYLQETNLLNKDQKCSTEEDLRKSSTLTFRLKVGVWQSSCIETCSLKS